MTRTVDGELLALGAVPAVCPHLRVATGQWRLAEPSREHVCGAELPMMPLGLEAQRRLCHGVPGDCERFRAAAERRATMVPIPPGRQAARTAPVVVQRGRAALPVPHVLQRKVMRQAALALVMVLAAVALVLARWSGPASDGGTNPHSPEPSSGAPLGIGGVQPSASSPPVATPVPTHATTPSTPPSGSASPGSTAGSPPAASPSTAPSASFVSTRTYRVVANDTLSSIAAHFGTTVKTLQALNQITDPSLIRIGQVLRIP